MATVLVTGCNRGIGLELCRQYAARGDDVIGVCREAGEELQALGIRIEDGVDVSSDADVARLAEHLQGTPIDVLVNNAGIGGWDKLEDIDFETMLRQYAVNAIGPLRVTRALLPNLAEGAKVGLVTSRVGSIADNGSGNNYGYRCSKAAANMVGMNLHHDLAPRGISVALLHPGLVATDMTRGNGIPAADAAAGLMARLDELGPENSGRFWHAEGYPLPW